MYGCLSIILFGFLVFIISALLRFAHFFFRMRKTVRNFQDNLNGRNTNNERHTSNEGFTSTERAGTDHHHRPGEKFFEKDEGEYIEFEEISVKP